MWMGLAVVIGVGLRFVKLPDFMLPVVVGLAVTAAVVLTLRLFLSGPVQEGNKPAKRDDSTNGEVKSSSNSARHALKKEGNATNRRATRPATRRID